MKRVFLLLVPILAVISPLAVFAEAPVSPETETGTTAYDGRPASGEDAATPEAMRERGMKHRGYCRHEKGKGGRAHGGGHQGKHDEVVQRLDMIEARIAKIELMLESLMKRR